MQTLYHLTSSENIESILKSGLIPSIGDHRKNCSVEIERESDDPRVSLCDEISIDKWRSALFKKHPEMEIVLLRVDVEGLRLKKRKWATGYEYACWDLIEPGRIEIKDL